MAELRELSGDKERRTVPRWAFTVAAILVAIGLIGTALWFTVRTPRAAGTAARTKASIGRWHPEPVFLLQHEKEIDLTARQRRRAQTAQREWSLKKAAFDVQLSRYDLNSDKALAMLNKGQMGEGPLAKLMAFFEEERGKAWERATSLLEPDQVIKLDAVKTRILEPKK